MTMMNQPDKSDFPHAFWILPVGLALLVLGMWMGTHDGFTPDFSQFSLDQAQSLSILPTARFWGVVYQLIKHMPFILLFGCSALGYGLLVTDGILRYQKASMNLAAGLGLGILMWLAWSIAALGFLATLSAWLLVAIGSVCCIGFLFLRQRADNNIATSNGLSFSAWLLICPMIGLALVACCCPPGTLWRVEAFGYDVTSYHLQIPKEWMANGQLTGLNHNVYSYLPSLMEGTFLFLGYLMGSVYRAIYLCQLIHFSMAILAALQVAKLASKWITPFAANLTGALLLCVPWTLITGSMAYNEMTAIVMGTTALLILFDDPIKARWASVLTGIMLGLATFAKLTAGPMLALPLAAMVLFKANTQQDRKTWHVGLLILASALTLSPYFLRNAIQTGNPVFPFATSIFGNGHWTDKDVDRWQGGHHNNADMSTRLKAVGWQWLGNQGYGAIGGHKRIRLPGAIESQNIAHFEYESGVSPWWVLALLGGVGMLFIKSHRKLAIILFGILFFQLLFWIFGTHLQARFLIWTLIPGVLLLGIGVGRFDQNVFPRWISRGVLTSLILLCSSISLNIMLTQTPSKQPLWQFIDSLMPEEKLADIELGQAIAGDHLTNHLPAKSKVYFIADASRMLYVNTDNIYHSAFDASQLGRWFRDANGDQAKLIATLKKQGITHLYIHWSELERLHATYGYDADVTQQSLDQLTHQWAKAFEIPNVISLYIVP